MIDFKSKRQVWILILVLLGIGVVSSFIFINKLSKENQSFINIFSILGVCATLLALVLTFIQFLSLIEIALKTNEEIQKATGQIKKVLAISDISKTSKIILEIKRFVQENKFESAELRMQNLKTILIQIKNDLEIKEIIDEGGYKESYSNFIIDLNNIDSYLVDNTNEVDSNIIVYNLEALSMIIIEIEQYLKK